MAVTTWTITAEEQIALVAGPVGSVWAPGTGEPAEEVATALFTDSFTGTGTYTLHEPDIFPTDFVWGSVLPSGQELTGTGYLAASSEIGNYFEAESLASSEGWITSEFPLTFKLQLDFTARGADEVLESELSYAIFELAQTANRWALYVDRSNKLGHIHLEYPTAEGSQTLVVPEVFLDSPGTVAISAYVELTELTVTITYGGTALSATNLYTNSIEDVDTAKATLMQIRLAGAGVDLDFVEIEERAYVESP